MRNREAHPGIEVCGRLTPGVTLLQVQSELSLIGRSLAEQYPASTGTARSSRNLFGHSWATPARPCGYCSVRWAWCC